MASRSFISLADQFNSAASAYAAAASLRPSVHDDEGTERLNNLVEPLFEELARIPADSPAAIVVKIEAIVAEFGECELIPVDLVQLVLEDVLALIPTVQ